jgi:hypothetical protein
MLLRSEISYGARVAVAAVAPLCSVAEITAVAAIPYLTGEVLVGPVRPSDTLCLARTVGHGPRCGGHPSSS